MGGGRTKLWLGLVKVAPELLGRCEKTIGWTAEHFGLIRLPATLSISAMGTCRQVRALIGTSPAMNA